MNVYSKIMQTFLKTITTCLKQNASRSLNICFVGTYKKMLNIYKNSNKNNNNIISQRKVVLINITLISTIAEWESEYKK